MASVQSDSGVESNADVEMLGEAHKGVIAGVQSSSAPDSRNAAVVSPSESSTSDVSGELSRRRRQEERINSTSRQNSSNDNDENDQDEELGQDEDKELDSDGGEDQESDIAEEIEEGESGEPDDEEYRHNSSVGEESSASFGRDGQPVDCIVCGVCRRQFPLNQFGTFIEHKVSSECRRNNNNIKRNSSDESATEFFSPAAYQRRRPRTLAGSETKRSLSACVGREVATETTDTLGIF